MIRLIQTFKIRQAKKFYDGLGYKFIELVNFTKETEDELDSNIDRWLYVLKNMSKLNKIPTFLRKTIFESIFNLAEYSKLKKEESDMYDSSLKKKWDLHSIEETLRLEKEKAIEEAVEKAVKNATEETAKKTAKETAIETAKKMLNRGYAIAEIAAITGMTEKEIKALK